MKMKGKCNIVKLLNNSIHTAPNSAGTLTWHNGVIPSTEIWIKLGGDKGGGTFKMNL